MKRLTSLLAAALLVAPVLASVAFGAGAERMTKEELLKKLDGGEVTVIDVRTKGDWDKSGEKIKGAVRADSRKIGSWAGKHGKEDTIVLYCS